MAAIHFRTGASAALVHLPRLQSTPHPASFRDVGQFDTAKGLDLVASVDFVYCITKPYTGRTYGCRAITSP